MVDASRPKPTKENSDRKPAGAPLFDPGVFLATAAVGRGITDRQDVPVGDGVGGAKLRRELINAPGQTACKSPLCLESRQVIASQRNDATC
jgi:hypothetical protein